MSVAETARLFGLAYDGDGQTSTFRRADTVVRLGLGLDDRLPEERNALLIACLGARLGIDRLRFDTASQVVPPLDLIQRLVPRAAAALAARIAGVAAAGPAWLPRTPFSLIYVHEVAKDTVFATASDLKRGPAARAIEDARRALFYRAYQLRPERTEVVGAGRLSVFRTTGGLASSVATLLPDFDYDAARDRGVLAVTDYDTLLVWRPQDGGRPGAALRRAVHGELRRSTLPLSRRLYGLRPSGVVVGETCGTAAEFDAAEVVEKLISVS